MTEEEINICKLLCTGEKHNIELAKLLTQGLGLTEKDIWKKAGYDKLYSISCNFDNFQYIEDESDPSSLLTLFLMKYSTININDNNINTFIYLNNLGLIISYYLEFDDYTKEELPFISEIVHHVRIYNCPNLKKLPYCKNQLRIIIEDITKTKLANYE